MRFKLENRTRVVVYGNTLSMAGIAASLKVETTLDVFCVDPKHPSARKCLFELDPQTIIFDRTEPHPELDLALLREQPGLLLVGVDPSSDDVLVLTGQRNRVVSARELAHLVSASAPQSTVEKDVKGDDEGGAFGFPN
jgi:hypothetical protein